MCVHVLTDRNGLKNLNFLKISRFGGVRCAKMAGGTTQSSGGKAPNARRNPIIVRGNRPIARGNASGVRGNPKNVRGNWIIVRGSPPNVRGSRIIARGNPIIVRGNWRGGRGNPPKYRGKAIIVRGNRPKLRGKALFAGGNRPGGRANRPEDTVRQPDVAGMTRRPPAFRQIPRRTSRWPARRRQIQIAFQPLPYSKREIPGVVPCPAAVMTAAAITRASSRPAPGRPARSSGRAAASGRRRAWSSSGTGRNSGCRVRRG